MKLQVRHFFDAAHQLKDTPSLVTKECASLHGHTYAVIVEAEEQTLIEGMVVDFKAIKQIIDRLDHQFVNQVFDEHNIEKQPTAENIAIVLFTWIVDDLKIDVTSVAVCEGYKGLEKASWAIYEPKGKQ